MAFAGGRPGMISAATGAMALLMVTLVKDYGLQYLLAATILTGALQIVAGWLRLGALMRFVSRSVITGFVTALAILIFMAQLPELIGVSWVVYAMVAAGLAIIYLFPYLSKAGCHRRWWRSSCSRRWRWASISARLAKWSLPAHFSVIYRCTG
jgi:SulP family sulfate permease